MQFTELAAFTVIGIEARTSFPREKEPGGLIPKLWERFMAEGILAQIPNRIDREIVALYTDYASDEYGEYTLILGARVSSADTVPAGMTARHIPEARYAVFTSEPSPVAHAAIDTWLRIWREPRTPQYTRAYRADFEIYGAKAADPANSIVDIFIGLEP